MEHETPLSLMQMALAFYDRRGDGETTVASYLQAAIDTATGAKPLQPGEEIDPVVIEAFFARIDRRTPDRAGNDGEIAT